MSSPLDRLTAALADRYRIEHELGAGGMATVYLAHDVKHNRRVAVKVLRPELSAILGGERFLQEIEVTANLQHPNILPLYDSGEADSFLYYVMPYVEGESLRDRLEREKQLAIDDALGIARAVAGALDFAHERGVIHRDIKPENILLQAGQALVADFGIALALSAAGGGTRLTETGLSIGTPHYMSPEQASADRELDGRSDVYSLGAVLYEMLAGQPPFTSSSAQAIVAKILTEPPPSVTKERPSVPPHVDAALRVALAKLPADRFASAGALSAALANPAFTSADSPLASGMAVGMRSKRSPRRWASAAGLLVLGVAAGFVLRGGADADSDVVRLHLKLPTGQQLRQGVRDDAPFAISPDGRRIAYTAIDSGQAVSRLYIRALDDIEAMALTGTDGAVTPFFSPDGVWIGFFTDGQLKKVPAVGGVPVVVANGVDQISSGSWGAGYIWYTSRNLEVARVKDTGGAPEVVVRRPAGNLFTYGPAMLPGGDAVLATECSGGCAVSDLVVIDVASGVSQVLVPGAARGWYVGGETLVYTTGDGAVFGVRFDPGRREIAGSPVPLLPAVRLGGFRVPQFRIAESGDIIYVPGDVASGVRIVEVDRSGRETALLPQTGSYQHPRWSPQRDRVAMTVETGTDAQIWIYDVTSETLTQFTFEGASVRPTWSPDGSMLAYYSSRDGVDDLYWKRADGSAPAERVADGPDTDNAGTTFWTRDGAWIVVDGFGDSLAEENVFAIGTGTDRTRRPAVESPAREETGAVSPNGQWIAYGSDEAGAWQVYVRPFLSEGGRWLVSTGAGGTPLWTSDTEVVYVDYVAQTLVAATLEFGSTVRVVQRTTLFPFDDYVYQENSPMYDVSRDGQSFLLLRRERADTENDPVVVLNWMTEVEQLLREQGGR